MKVGKALGLTLAGCALLAAAPLARAGEEDASMKERIQDLEAQVQELREQLTSKDASEASSLAEQIDRYLQGDEKGSLWLDRNGRPLSKAVESMWIEGSVRIRPEYWRHNANFANGSPAAAGLTLIGVGGGGYSPYDQSMVNAAGLFKTVNRGVSGLRDDSGMQTFTRARLGIGANLHEDISAFIELDMSGSMGNAARATPQNDGGFMITPTMYQAYVDGVWAKELGVDNTRIGRFELALGDEFIFGDYDFFNGGYAHDGIVITKDFRDQGFSANLVATNAVEGYKNGINASADANVYAFGIYANWYDFAADTGAEGGLEPFYVVVLDNADVPAVPGGSTNDIHTAGARWWGDRSNEEDGGLEWNVNAAGQLNHNLQWAADAQAWWHMGGDSELNPSIWGQVAYASGDSDVGDPGYNPLWQDPHGRYGYSDLWTFSNLVVFGLGLEIHPREDLTYGISSRSMHTARKTASSSKVLAWEHNFYVRHQYSENVEIEAAAAWVVWRGTLATRGFDDVQRAYLNLLVWF